MRKRHIAALAVVAGLAITGGLAIADPNDTGTPAPVPAPAGTGPVTVTLPTGDTVEVVGESLLPRPAAGREDIGFVASRAFGRDRIVLPLDKAGSVRSGRTDERLYNVDALLRGGVTDAREVESPDSLGEADTGAATGKAGKAGKATRMDFEFSWLDGGVPPETWPMIVGLDDHGTRELEVTDGKGTIELAPGEYSMVVDMLERGQGDEPWTSVSTVVDFEVTRKTETLAVDGTRAVPVSVDLDADAALEHQRIELFTGAGTAVETQFAHSVNFAGGDRLYAIPAEQRGEHPGGFTLQTESVDADGDTYSLVNTVDAGIPADLDFEVAASDLAARETEYGSLGGTDSGLTRSNWGYHPSHVPFLYPFAAPAKQTQTRTEHFTAGPEVGWTQLAQLPDAEAAVADHVIVDSGRMEAGTEDMTWLTAPLSVRLPGGGSPYFHSGVQRWPAGWKTDIAVAVPMFSGPLPGQATISRGVTGKWSVDLDGERIASGTDAAEFPIDLADDAAGRFTVAVEAAREVPWTPLGTKSSAVWEFDSAPVEEQTALGLSTVRFQADGVTGGYASAAEPQAVTLDFETQPGAEDRSCASLGFEVSYDDGETWTDVDLDRDGDHATAALDHPAGAEFVSVRFNATDDRGQTVTTSTIRSYGLK